MVKSKRTGRARRARGKQATTRRLPAAVRDDLEVLENDVGGAEELARILARSERSLQRWHAGEVSGFARQVLRLLAAASWWLDISRLAAGADALRSAWGLRTPGEGDSRAALPEDVAQAGPVEPPEHLASIEATSQLEVAQVRAAGLLRVRHRDGRVEETTAAHAAYLCDTGQASPLEDWTEADLAALLSARHARQDEQARRLESTGQLVGGLPGRGPRIPDKFNQGPDGPMGRLRWR